jgi:aerobic carbon-monoxide dehydrogenase large subunit
LTGTGRFTADWDLPGQAHAAILRSRQAHARIVSIDTSAARAARRSRGSDRRGLGGGRFQEHRVAEPRPGTRGIRHARARPSGACNGRVRFVGEPIAIAVAETEAQALDACERSTPNSRTCRS